MQRQPVEQGLPHDEEFVAQMVRLQLYVASSEACEHVLHAHLRPHVVLALLFTLIRNRHQAFCDEGGELKASPSELERLMTEAVDAKYPTSEEDKKVPLEERRGRIPPKVHEAMVASMRVKARPGGTYEKNATPAL